MALNNIFYTNPEHVVEVAQVRQIKFSEGCNACLNRNFKVQVFGKAVCGLAGNYPGSKGFCKSWLFDEGFECGNN